MSVILVINPLHFDLIIKNESIKFHLDEIQTFEIKNKINYKSLVLFLICTVNISYFIFLFFQVSYFNLILLNLLLFLLYNDFIYKKVSEINLKISDEHYNFILDDESIIFEFEFLYSLYKKQVD